MAINGEACAEGLILLNESPISVQLFVNNHTPVITDASNLSNYTLASFSGSDPIELDAWETPIDDAGKAHTDHETVQWTPGSGASGIAYGVVLVRVSSGKLITGLRFATPKAIVEGVPISCGIRQLLQDRSVS